MCLKTTYSISKGVNVVSHVKNSHVFCHLLHFTGLIMTIGGKKKKKSVCSHVYIFPLIPISVQSHSTYSTALLFSWTVKCTTETVYLQYWIMKAGKVEFSWWNLHPKKTYRAEGKGRGWHLNVKTLFESQVDVGFLCLAADRAGVDS